jgi:hypothetical protein
VPSSGMASLKRPSTRRWCTKSVYVSHPVHTSALVLWPFCLFGGPILPSHMFHASCTAKGCQFVKLQFGGRKTRQITSSSQGVLVSLALVAVGNIDGLRVVIWSRPRCLGRPLADYGHPAGSESDPKDQEKEDQLHG